MKQKKLDSCCVQRALKAAKLVRDCSDFEKFRLGAAIFTNKRIVALGFNERKSNPMQRKYNIVRPRHPMPYCGSMHAEMMALKHLQKEHPGFNGSDYSILVYREHCDGTFAMARPCPACEKALREAGITNIYYTGDASMIYENYKVKKQK